MLWCLDSIVNPHCKKSLNFQCLLRLTISPTIRRLANAGGGAGVGPPEREEIVELAAEVFRVLSSPRIPLPLETHYTEHDLKRVQQLLQQLENDPLRCTLSQGEQDFLWDFRREPLLTDSPPMLAKVLLAAPDWEERRTLAELHSLPAAWAAPRVAELLQVRSKTLS